MECKLDLYRKAPLLLQAIIKRWEAKLNAKPLSYISYKKYTKGNYQVVMKQRACIRTIKVYTIDTVCCACLGEGCADDPVKRVTMQSYQASLHRTHEQALRDYYCIKEAQTQVIHT